MSLRLQLLAFGALILILPWAGLRIVQEWEALLRANLESSLLADAGQVAAAVAVNAETERRRYPVAASGPPLYAYALSRQPKFDRGLADWQFRRDAGVPAAARAIPLEDGSRVWLGIYEPFVYLYVDVPDDDHVLEAAGGRAPYGDRLVLAFGGGGGRAKLLLIASPAEGARADGGKATVRPTAGAPAFVPLPGTDDSVTAYWQPTGARGGGYAIEAWIPLGYVEDGLGIGIIDSDSGNTTSAELVARTWRTDPEPGPIVREEPAFNELLARFSGSGVRYRILDNDGWVLADSGPLALGANVGGTTEPLRPGFTERFFRRVLRRDDPDYSTVEDAPAHLGDPKLRSALGGEPVTAWYRQGQAVNAIVAAAYPIESADPRLGVVLVEQASDSILTVAPTNRALTRILTTIVLVSLLVAVSLLGYASLLSLRVGRLARAAGTALGPRGEIESTLPGTRARDEIGALARSFEDLLKRLREYTEYLQSLKSKLTHELRTPLAIVATSLDNLEHETGTDQGRAYLGRLRHGTARLESILQAMTAATRVEQAIAETSFERFDLEAVVAACVAAYGDVYTDRRFVADLPEAPVFIEGSPDLIEQLLDKLIDNAVGFATPGTPIEVGLEVDGRSVRLTVSNRGPRLPDAMRHQIFDSLVSMREKHGDKPHLGLGLYIVTLIAEFHGGGVSAENLADGSGVVIGVALPLGDAGSA